MLADSYPQVFMWISLLLGKDSLDTAYTEFRVKLDLGGLVSPEVSRLSDRDRRYHPINGFEVSRAIRKSQFQDCEAT